MNRFLLFSGDVWYPSGGWNDFSGDFPTQEEALKFAANNTSSYMWFHIVDSETKKIVYSKGRD